MLLMSAKDKWMTNTGTLKFIHVYINALAHSLIRKPQHLLFILNMKKKKIPHEKTVYEYITYACAWAIKRTRPDFHLTQ